MTNWVTIRVPESDREDAKAARPDDATHGDCLVAGAKALAGDDGESIAETAVDVTPEIDDDAVADGASLAEIQEAIETVEARTGRLEQMLEDVTER